MNWMITELHNWPVILCGAFYSVLCVFSIVTGLMYASGKRALNLIELSSVFLKSLSDGDKLRRFAIKMGWITFVVGIVQGLTAVAIFKGYNVFLNIFAIGFTIFSICSVTAKLIGKINAFSMIKLVFYLLILVVLILNGMNNYGATKEVLSYLDSSNNVSVTKIKEGYFFDGPGTNTAIVFFPGARVQYTAYAKLMYKIAEDGEDCFLMSVPFNLAFFGANKPNKIIEKYNYNNWYISGHSLGGVVACSYASNNPDIIKGIIGLATYPNQKLPDSINYISIYGSEDKVLKKEKLEETKDFLPTNNNTYVIEGGNHSGFANYGKQKGDGKANITSDEQQDFVVNTIKEREI